MKIVWTWPARNDLTQVISFIGNENRAAAKRISGDIHAATRKIVDFPNIGRPGKLEGTREFSVFSINYNIVYRVHGNTVEILGLLHHKQQWP